MLTLFRTFLATKVGHLTNERPRNWLKGFEKKKNSTTISYYLAYFMNNNHKKHQSTDHMLAIYYVGFLVFGHIPFKCLFPCLRNRFYLKKIIIEQILYKLWTCARFSPVNLKIKNTNCPPKRRMCFKLN